MLYRPNLKSTCALAFSVIVGLLVLGAAESRAQSNLPENLGAKLLMWELDSRFDQSEKFRVFLKEEYVKLKEKPAELLVQRNERISQIKKLKLSESATNAAIKVFQQEYEAELRQVQEDMYYILGALNFGPRIVPPSFPQPFPSSVPCPPAIQAPRHPLFRRLSADRGTGLNHRSIETFRQVMDGYKKLQAQGQINFVASSPARMKSATEPSFDVRKQFGSNIVYAVQDQGQCGSCWGFAAVAAFEASHAYQFRTEASVSEQSVLSCANKLAPTVGTDASCNGAFADAGLATLTKVGAVDRRALPYTESNRPDLCSPVSNPAYKGHEFGPVNVDSNAPPSIDMIKSHVKEYGAVVVGMKAGSQFRSAQEGVSEDFIVTEDTGEQADHAVTIIGWDDTKANGRGAWLVRNSWGPDFGHTGGLGGSRGYIWVQYERSAIGGEAFWIKAQQSGAGPGPVTPGGNPDIRRAIDYWTKMGRS